MGAAKWVETGLDRFGDGVGRDQVRHLRRSTSYTLRDPQQSDATSTAMSARGCEMVAGPGCHGQVLSLMPVLVVNSGPPGRHNRHTLSIAGRRRGPASYAGRRCRSTAGARCSQLEVVAAALVVFDAKVPPERQTPGLREAHLLAQLGLTEALLARAPAGGLCVEVQAAAGFLPSPTRSSEVSRNPT